MTTIRVFCDGPSHPEGSKWWVAEFVDRSEVNARWMTAANVRRRTTPLVWKEGGRAFGWEVVYSVPPARQMRRLAEAVTETPGPLDTPGAERSDLDARQRRFRADRLERFERAREQIRRTLSGYERSLTQVIEEMDLQFLTNNLQWREDRREKVARAQRVAAREREMAAGTLLPPVGFAAGRRLRPTHLDGDEIAEGYGERAAVRLECRRCRVARDVRGEKLSAILDALAARGLREVSLQSIIRVLS